MPRCSTWSRGGQRLDLDGLELGWMTLALKRDPSPIQQDLAAAERHDSLRIGVVEIEQQPEPIRAVMLQE